MKFDENIMQLLVIKCSNTETPYSPKQKAKDISNPQLFRYIDCECIVWNKLLPIYFE